VEHSLRGLALTKKAPMAHDFMILAAAYSHLGNFESAVQYQWEALSKAEPGEMKTHEDLLRKYQRHEAFSDPR
jgi:hypothetical protein